MPKEGRPHLWATAESSPNLWNWAASSRLTCQRWQTGHDKEKTTPKIWDTIQKIQRWQGLLNHPSKLLVLDVRLVFFFCFAFLSGKKVKKKFVLRWIRHSAMSLTRICSSIVHYLNPGVSNWLKQVGLTGETTWKTFKGFGKSLLSKLVSCNWDYEVLINSEKIFLYFGVAWMAGGEDLYQ